MNAALCAMLGFTEDELLALPLTSLPGTPADADRFLQVSATKNPGRCESTLRKKDGTLVPVELFFQTIPDETGGQPCTGVFIVDISDRRQRTELVDEERRQYRAFFQTGSAAMLITTPGGVILAANPAACRLFGRTGDELRSVPGEGLAGAGDPRFVELSRMCAEAGSAEGELRLIRGDDAPFDVMVEAARFLDQDGSPAMNMILRDITGQKRPEGHGRGIRRQPRPFSTACQIPSAGPIPAAHASFSTRHGLHLQRLLPMNRETAGAGPVNASHALLEKDAVCRWYGTQDGIWQAAAR